MLVKEYRIVLPFTVTEFQAGRLFTVIETTTGDVDAETVKDEPFSNTPLFDGAFDCGQYTKKIHNVKPGDIPSIVKTILPNRALICHEETWDAYPYRKTVYTNPDYMKDSFFIKIESMHLPDRGTTENAHNLSPKELAQRGVIHIDLGNDKEYLKEKDITMDLSPSQYKSFKTDRGPLRGDWRENVKPVMCAYILVSMHFKWFGAQNMVESYAVNKAFPRILAKFHRKAFCWIDYYIDMSMTEMRIFEQQVKRQREQERQNELDKASTE